MAANSIASESLDRIFREARTFPAWTKEKLSTELLREIYDLAKFGPTSMNTSPARFVFITTPEAKERLLPAIAPGNVGKVRAAPVTVIMAWDAVFYDQLPKLFPAMDGRPMFAGNPAMAEESAFRNSTLQNGYFILAARALGLDCGPMSGFDAAKVNAEFFPDGKWKANMLCNLGFGDREKLHPRNPRLSFGEACVVL